MLGERALLAALQWLGFVDLSTSPGRHRADKRLPRVIEQPAGPERSRRRRPGGSPPEAQISLGVFVLTGSAGKRG
ncbi:hypothetical protein ACWKSP_20955 [Micromonosporaceae bacterium Da 78-11]